VVCSAECPEQRLHLPHVETCFQQMRRKAVAKRVTGHALADARAQLDRMSPGARLAGGAGQKLFDSRQIDVDGLVCQPPPPRHDPKSVKQFYEIRTYTEQRLRKSIEIV
jgi:hypothetical protein